MIKRAKILKILKESGKYERRFFTMKKGELQQECARLGIDINQESPGDKPKKVEKKKVQLLEPLSSSDDDSEEEIKIPQTPQLKPVEAPKKQKQKLNRRQIKEKEKEKEKEKVPKKDNIKEVNEILKDFSRATKELLNEFDAQEELDKMDEEYIRKEFNIMLNEIQDMIDPLISDASDSQVNNIEKKIDLQCRKVDRFLEITD